MDHLDGGDNDVSCRRQNLEPAKLPGCQVLRVPRTQPVLDMGSSRWGKRNAKVQEILLSFLKKMCSGLLKQIILQY